MEECGVERRARSMVARSVYISANQNPIWNGNYLFGFMPKEGWGSKRRALHAPGA